MILIVIVILIVGIQIIVEDTQTVPEIVLEEEDAKISIILVKKNI